MKSLLSNGLVDCVVSPNSKTTTEDSGVAASSVVGEELGAPPSYRAPNRCNGVLFQPLSQHIDSLEVSFKGELSGRSAEDLERCKGLAQSRDEAVRASAQVVIGDCFFEVSDKGAGLFPYVIRDSRFYIKLSRPGNRSVPMAHCQIRNVHLLQVGPSQALQDLRWFMDALGEVEGPEKISRVDLAVDFVSDVQMDSWGREAWVTRLEYKQAHSVGERFTGWSIGRKDALQFGFYDKTFEILRESGKHYLYEIWDQAGWAPWDSVWRAEGRFRRPVLAQFDLNTLGDALSGLPGLWVYLTETSLRLTAPNHADATRARWPNHPLWDSIAKVAWDVPLSRLTRHYKHVNAPSDRTLAIREIANLTSVMARDGILEIGVARDRLRDIVMSQLMSIHAFSDREPEEILIEKAREKGRRYGTINNVAGTPALPPADDAAAQAYRKASKGK
jgi:hypothetical protein